MSITPPLPSTQAGEHDVPAERPASDASLPEFDARLRRLLDDAAAGIRASRTEIERAATYIETARRLLADGQLRGQPASVLAPSIPVAGALAVVRVVAVSSARTRGGSIQTAQPAAATSSGIPAAVQSNGMPWDDAVRWRSSGTRADGGAGPCRTRLGLQRSSRARSLAAFAIRRPAADRSRGPRAVGGRRG